MTPTGTPDPTQAARHAFRTLHFILALPWWAMAGLAGFLAIAFPDFQNVTLMVLGLAAVLAIVGLAVLRARRWSLIVSAVVGSLLAAGGNAGLGIRFIDSTPAGLTGTVWAFLNVASVAVLISGLIALVLGIVELKRSS